METEKYLCQLNVASMKTSLNDPSMKDFVDALDSINQLAEQHPGFIWRLKEAYDENNSSSPFLAHILVNMSIWTDVGSLRDFVYKSHHVSYMRRKTEWFNKVDVNQVLWWVPKGYIPTLEEAALKLNHLRTSGSTSEAFNMADALRKPVVLESVGA
jgi:hypothetical protein